MVNRGKILQPEFPFLRAGFLVPLIALWIGSTAWLIVRFRALDSDSIMYGLPLAFSSGPFSLSVPFLGDFPPYSTVWGHQWPGAMWIRGALYSFIPFDRWLDISLLLSCQFAAGFLAGFLVWRLTRGVAASICTALIVFSDRVVIAGLQLHRWEGLTNLALVSLLLALVEMAGAHRPLGKWLFIASGAAFVAACSHPIGMVIGGGLIGLGVLDWTIRRRSAIAAWTPVAGFLGGLGALAIYYGCNPEALAQFRANLALQNSFNSGHRLGFFTTHLRYYHYLGYILWAAVLIAGPVVFLRAVRSKDSRQAFSAWALPLAALAVPILFVLTRSANNSYAALGIPFAVTLVSCGVVFVAKHGWVRQTATVALCLLTLGFLSVYPYRWIVFFRNGLPNFPREMTSILERVPGTSRVYIPPPLWDAARRDTERDYRLWSLSIAAPRATRLEYESKVYSELKPGDILIVDRISGTTGDPWGILPTFETRPPNPEHWELKFNAVNRVPGAGHDFGYDLAVYEFKGGEWSPGENPRTMTGR